MTTSCCADGDLSGAAPSNKQRWRTSNRIKLSRELMIKLTAAAAALSNNGGGNSGDGDERVRDVRNGSQVVLNNGTFAHLSSSLSSSSSTNNLREYESQTSSNNKSGQTNTEEKTLLTERRGINSNTCDNIFNKNGQLLTSWPQSLLQQQQQQKQQQQQQTSPLTPSQLSASNLVRTSSMKNDCSSILAASVGDTSTNTADSLPKLNQCNFRPVQQQQQHNSMPIQNNGQYNEAPLIHVRSGAIKHCFNNDDGDDNDTNKERATSIGGVKSLVSDADNIIQTSTCYKSTPFKRAHSPQLSKEIQLENKKSSSNTCSATAFSKSFVFDVDLQKCRRKLPVNAVDAVKETQKQPLIKANHVCLVRQKKLIGTSTTLTIKDNLRRRKQQHCNEKSKTSCYCLAAENHEFNIFRKISPSLRCRRRRATKRESQQSNCCCSPNIRQMSLLNSSIDNDTSSSFTTFSSQIKTHSRSSTSRTNSNNNITIFSKANYLSLNREYLFNVSPSSNSNSQTKITSGNEKLSNPERCFSHKRILREQRQQLNSNHHHHHHHHRYPLASYFERGSLRQRHHFKKRQQRQRRGVLNGLTNSTKNNNHLLGEQSEKSSSFKVIKVDPKLNLAPIETKTNDDNDNYNVDNKNNNNNSTNYNNDNNNCKSLFFINKENEEQQQERKQVTRIVSNHSSVIILKAIKDVDSSNLHLNHSSTFSCCSIKDVVDDDDDDTLRSKINNQQIKDITTKTTTTSCKTSSDKIKAHLLCYSPEKKPIKIVVEREEEEEKEAQIESDKQALFEISSLKNLKDEEIDEKEKKKENLLINKIKRNKRENTSSCSNINRINSNSKSSNSCLVDRKRGGNNINNNNDSSERSEESFECDNNLIRNNNLKNQIEIIKRKREQEEIVARKIELKRKVRPNNDDLVGNNYQERRKTKNTRTNIKRKYYHHHHHRNSSLFIWFSMILIGCLLLQFESSSSADHEKSSAKSQSSSLFGFVSPIGRVNGQSTSDELSRAVLATMSTQSPSILSNNSIGQQYSTTSSMDEESYLINNQDSNNQSPKTMMNQYDQSAQQQDQDQNLNNNSNNNNPSTSSSFFDKFLDFGRIFIIGAIIIGDICGNSLVILSVCRHSKLRVTTNWFVVSLACADILVAVFAMTFNASVIISGRWLFKPWVCDFWNSCDVLASTASILHLCCISIDRYIAITRPLDYPMKITTRRVIYALCGVWISSALLSYLPIFTGVYTTSEHIKWLNDNPEQCDFVVNRVYAIVSSSISFWIPSSIMVFTYYRIYKEATRQEKFMYKQQSMMPAPMANHHHHHHHDSSNHYNKSSSSHHHRSKQRRSKSMAVSSSAANALTSNEARIRQLAKQQQELQPTSAAIQQQRLNQTNSFNSIATTNLNNSTISSSIPAVAAAESNTATTTTAPTTQQTCSTSTATCSTTALLPANSSLLNNQKSSSSNLDISAEQRASSLLQLSGNNLNAAESQPLTAPAPILALTPPTTTNNNNNSTTKTTSLSVVPNSNGATAATTDSKLTAAPAGKSSTNKKSTPAVAFNEGRGNNNNNNPDQEHNDDDEDDEDDDLDSNSGQSTPTKRSISKMKREHKAAKTLGIIMGVFILCWLPFFSWYTPQHICGHACDGMVPRGAVTILFWIGYFNSTLNPIIYAYFNHEFRDAFKKTLQWLFCCCNDLKCLRVNRPNDNQHYNCTYRSTQEIGLVSNS